MWQNLVPETLFCYILHSLPSLSLILTTSPVSGPIDHWQNFLGLVYTQYLGNGVTDVFDFSEVDVVVYLSQSEAASEMIHV